MTPEIVARLRALMEKATPCNDVAVSWYHVKGINHPQFETDSGAIAQSEADYELYAEARTALPTLLSEIEALHAALADLDKAALGLVQVWNRMGDKYGRNAPTVAECDAAKQAVHDAREAARRLVEAKGD